MNGLFQPISQDTQFPMLDPNGTTNGIPNAIINESRRRANAANGAQPPASPPPPPGWMSPEELRAQTGRLQSYGNPNASQMSSQPQGDMSVMYNDIPSVPADMPTIDGTSENPPPTYVGNPVLDKYIHVFIGGA